MEYKHISKTFFKRVVSPLQSALLNGLIEKIEKILCVKFGAKLSSHEDEVNKCKEIVELCLNLKINLNLPEDNYSTLLHFVANKLDDEIFKSVLSRITGLNINGLYLGRTLLHTMIQKGKDNKVKALLDFGADVNVKDDHKETPLFYAFSKKNATLVRLLLNCGGEMNYENFKLGSSHSLAIWDTSKEVLEILLEAGYDVTENNNGMLSFQRTFRSFYDVDNCSWDNIKLMCKYGYGTGMNLNNSPGNRLLHRFCQNGLLDDVRFAEKYGANLFYKHEGSTALHQAAFGNNFALVDYLLRQGLDINVKAKYDGKTPLHALSEFGKFYKYFENILPEFREERTKQYVAMIEFFVDNGADVNARDDSSLTPAEKSIYRNYLDISECFFALSAIVNFEWLIRCFANTTDSSDNKSQRFLSQRYNTFKLSIKILATKEKDISPYLQGVSKLTTSESIKSIFEKYKMEVSQMKASKICRDSNISFFDFMSKDLMDVTIFSRNEELLLVLEAGKYKRKFPVYKYLLEKRVERVKLLRNYLNAFTLFLKKFFKGQLPFVVLHIIFSFLRVGDVRNFGRALRISNDFPNGCIDKL